MSNRRNPLPARPHRKRGLPDADGVIWTKARMEGLKAELVARMAAFKQSAEYRRLREQASRADPQGAAPPSWTP